MEIPESAQAEAQKLVSAFPGEETFLLGLLERQLNILHQRSQVVIGFAAVALTTTGFSGRLIAGTSLPAQTLIILALMIILLSCLWIFTRVLAVKWVLTRCIQPELTQTLTAIIAGVLAGANKEPRGWGRTGGIMCGAMILFSTKPKEGGD